MIPCKRSGHEVLAARLRCSRDVRQAPSGSLVYGGGMPLRPRSTVPALDTLSRPANPRAMNLRRRLASGLLLALLATSRLGAQVTLYGTTATDLVTIDTTTGATTIIGALNLGPNIG